MRSRHAVLGIVLCSALTLSLAQPAAAQRQGEWAIGYSFLGNNDLAVLSSKLPLGWFGGGALELTDNLAIAFDVSGDYAWGIDVCGGVDSKSLPFEMQPAQCQANVVLATPGAEFQGYSNNRAEAQWCSVRLSTCKIQAGSMGGFAGPRVSFGVGNVRPFVHVMGGAVRSVRKILFHSHTSTNWAVMPGVGVDIDVNEMMDFRVQADYRRVFFGSGISNASLQTAGADFNEFRVAVGFVFQLGG